MKKFEVPYIKKWTFEIDEACEKWYMWTIIWRLNFEIDKTCDKCDKILTDKLL